MLSWNIEVIRRRTDGSGEIDWVRVNPGPAMRGHVGSWFRPGIAGPSTEVVLKVTHVPSLRAEEAVIIKDRRRFRARHKGELLTLEAAAKMMKEELLNG